MSMRYDNNNMLIFL